ncbi:MAG: hypothetical protein KAS21_11125 [Candidatus Aminicenantes bacterium]|nr:hypothetical protein [Candidatus Aminicenantes bacterium]
MNYIEDFMLLKERFDHSEKKINIPELETEILNIPFESEHFEILPGEKSYKCREHNSYFPPAPPFQDNGYDESIKKLINVNDSKIEENRFFSFPVLRKAGSGRSKKAIILFHGLNEKSWDKYLPWAQKLMEKTGKTIIMFPLAFHMNRAPAEWSDPRAMRKVVAEKKKLFPRTIKSSIANAAINTRLQFDPLRFMWSGLQSYYDVIQLVNSVRSGKYSFIEPDAKIDMFAYSIGSFLAEILLMADTSGFFKDSKLFNFCGGPVLTRTSPVSKYILDSETNVSVLTFFIDYLDEEIRKDERLKHYFDNGHMEGEVFRSMLDYRKKKEFREDKFRKLSKRIFALGLKKDEVIPPFEIINTLKGEKRNIPIKVKVMDLDYDYDHVIPFPTNWNIEKEVDKAFNKVFKIASKFLK